MEKERVELRYYELSQGMPLVALLGEKFQKWEYLFVDEENFLKQAMSGQVFRMEQVVKRLQERTLVLPTGEGGECNFLIKSILDEMRIKGELYSVVVKAKLMALLIELVRLNPEENFTETMNIHDKVLESILDVLECSDDNLSDIALRSGFQTTSTFIRNFKRIVGVVPKDWRRMAKSGVDNPVNYNVSVLKGW